MAGRRNSWGTKAKASAERHQSETGDSGASGSMAATGVGDGDPEAPRRKASAPPGVGSSMGFYMKTSTGARKKSAPRVPALSAGGGGMGARRKNSRPVV